MATKTISLPEDVYQKLAEEKREGESFGDVIDRLLQVRPLSEFWGAWSDETAALALEATREGRTLSDQRVDRLYD